jgi:SPP1 gp7 family putative phage head morphogenesis protein
LYTDEELEQLEQEEREITEEEIALMLLLLASVRKDLENEIREFYQKYGKDGVVTYAEARKWISNKDHRRRLTVLLLFISQSFNNLLDDLKPHFEKLVKDIWDKEFEFFKGELPDEIDTLNWGADDKNWEDRLEDDITAWNYNVQNKVKQGLLKRDNLNDVLEDISDVFDYADRAISVLGLTESTATGTHARQEIFKQHKFKKYRFYTQADERTCKVCGSMHGLIFPVSAMVVGVNASPLHPNCRCFEVPVE